MQADQIPTWKCSSSDQACQLKLLKHIFEVRAIMPEGWCSIFFSRLNCSACNCEMLFVNFFCRALNDSCPSVIFWNERPIDGGNKQKAISESSDVSVLISSLIAGAWGGPESDPAQQGVLQDKHPNFVYRSLYYCDNFSVSSRMFLRSGLVVGTCLKFVSLPWKEAKETAALILNYLTQLLV